MLAVDPKQCRTIHNLTHLAQTHPHTQCNIGSVYTELYNISHRVTVKSWLSALLLLIITDALFWGLTVACSTFVSPVSRRMANLSFVLWQVKIYQHLPWISLHLVYPNTHQTIERCTRAHLSVPVSVLPPHPPTHPPSTTSTIHHPPSTIHHPPSTIHQKEKLQVK